MLDSWNDNEHHATVVAVSGYRCSVVPYLNKRVAKDKINERFRRKHSALGDTKIKLTKLRKYKMALLRLNTEKVCCAIF